MKRSALSILREDKAAAARFAEKASKERARKVLERAQRELNERLQQAIASGAGADSFTAAQLRATLEQVRAVLGPLARSLRVDMLDIGRQTADTSARDAIGYVQAAEDEFGLGRPLPLDSAALIDEAVAGTEASLARRIAADPNHPGQPGVIARYGLATMGKFEASLQQRLIQGKPWEAVKADLVTDSPFLQGQPAYWAERLLRTEAMFASNKASFETMKQVEGVIGPMLKVLVATFDDRTGADSYAVHGQIRRTNEAFESWFGPYMHPPNRPNDREVVVPHNMSWPLPPELKQLSDSAVAGRWAYEGRKGSPPPRPLMSTVDVEQVGKVEAAPLMTLPVTADGEPAQQLEPGELPKPPPPEPARVFSIPEPQPQAPQISNEDRNLVRSTAHLTSPLVEKAKIKKLGGGANDSKRMTWRDESGKLADAVWKPKAGEERGLRFSIRAGTYHQREAAAYSLDLLMGDGAVVPPTVSRTVKGEAGSLQQFSKGAKTMALVQHKGAVPDTFVDHPSTRRMQLLDFITANTDRHDGNYMVDRSGKAVAIDNGLSFPDGVPDRFLLAGRKQPGRAKLLEIDDAQKAMLNRLEPEKMARLLLDHGLEERAVTLALGRVQALKNAPTAMTDGVAKYTKHATDPKRAGDVYAQTVAEEWVQGGWQQHVTPEQQGEISQLVRRIKETQ